MNTRGARDFGGSLSLIVDTLSQNPGGILLKSLRLKQGQIQVLDGPALAGFGTAVEGP
jgi:hypothetical protein